MIDKIEQVVAIFDDSINQNLRPVLFRGHLGDAVEFFFQLLLALISQFSFGDLLQNLSLFNDGLNMLLNRDEFRIVWVDL